MQAFKLALSVLALLVCVSCGEDASDPTIYIIRHAEKMTDGADPGLTAEGQARAEGLVAFFEDIPIDAIYSTDLNRTKATAAPLADARDLEVQFYDPPNLKGFAEELIIKRENAVVFGHSNTNPSLAKFLGFDPGYVELPETDYETYYVVKLTIRGGKGEVQRFAADEAAD